MNDIEKDAARYRWLRDTQNMDFRFCENYKEGMIETIMVGVGGGCAEGPSSEELDALIDAAMEKNPCPS